jgi:hypothetical protein
MDFLGDRLVVLADAVSHARIGRWLERLRAHPEELDNGP